MILKPGSDTSLCGSPTKLCLRFLQTLCLTELLGLGLLVFLGLVQGASLMVCSIPSSPLPLGVLYQSNVASVVSVIFKCITKQTKGLQVS